MRKETDDGMKYGGVVYRLEIATGHTSK